MSHQIHIHHLDNRCRFLGKAEDLPFIQSELRQLAEGELSEQVAEEIDRRLQRLAQKNSVFHIRKLKLHLALPCSGFSTRSLSRALAGQLVSELEKQLSGSRENMVFFATQAEFIASFIGDLLAGRAWNTWYYTEFQALRHVTAQEGAVQMLLPRWDALPAIIRHLAPTALMQLSEAFDPSQARRLFTQWSSVGIERTFHQAFTPAIERLQTVWQQVQTLPVPTVPETSHERSLNQAAVRYFLNLLQALPGVADAEALLWLAAQRVFLLRYGEHIPALMEDHRIERGAHPAPALRDDQARVIAAALLLWIEKSDKHRDLVEQQRQSAQACKRPPAHSESLSDAEEQPGAMPEGMTLYSRHAGLALLIPVLFSLGLHHQCQMKELREALVLACGETDRPDSAESWLQKLFPDTHDNPAHLLTPQERAEPPQRWRLGLDAVRQQQLQQLVGAKQLAQLLLYQFAARLSGLQQSSNDYLRRQFLHCSGHFVFYKERIEAHIRGVPLAIVLRMSGLAHWSEKLPWLNRHLDIEVSD